MPARRVDLHAHTTASDGSLTPAELVERAERLGLAALAVTDHDTVAGVAPARAAAAAVEIVAGVELSLEAARGQLHLLGYFVDTADAEFLRVIGGARERRGPRMAAIVAKLNALGMDVTLSEVEAEAARGATRDKALGRPHVAAVLVKRGFAATPKEAFDRWLGEGKPAHVPKVKLGVEEAVRAVRNAGGVAVWAHPFSIPVADREALAERLALAGVAGVEVVYPKHDDALRAELRALARRHGWVESGGSDFHGAAKPDVELGCVHVEHATLEALRARR